MLEAGSASYRFCMAIGDAMARSRLPQDWTGLDYQGRRYRLLPSSPHAWMVLERKRCVGIVEVTYPHIGEDGPRFAAKRIGEERMIVDGWTDDWRLAVEWLADQDAQARG
jgi:hypothetical protein